MSHSFGFPQPDANDGNPGANSPFPNAPTDRRKRRRALITAPIRVRGTERDGPDEITTTVDVSRNGVLFVTNCDTFHRGMEVAVTFPFTKAASVPQSEQPGSVVRVSALSGGRVAIAIAFGFSSGEPTAAANRAALNPASNRVKHQAEGEDSQKPLILAVDADSQARDSLKAYLSSEGYRVIAVENASDAREVLNMMTPALLISEIEGEGLPGFDLCAHVKTTPRLRHIPVMLTTCSAYPSDYSNAHSLGAVVCMAKPYRQERLGHVVRLLVAPAITDAKAPPPRAPDPSRRPKMPGRPHRGGPGTLRFL
jgi:two-component system cell cycle response regulator DivK